MNAAVVHTPGEFRFNTINRNEFGATSQLHLPEELANDFEVYLCPTTPQKEPVMVIRIKCSQLLANDKLTQLKSLCCAVRDKNLISSNNADILLDFGNVKTLGSNFLGPLMTLRAYAKDIGVSLEICGMKDDLHDILKIARLSAVILPVKHAKHNSTLEEALKAKAENQEDLSDADTGKAGSAGDLRGVCFSLTTSQFQS